MPIVFVIIGLVLVVLSDKLQPNPLRKPKMNIYLSSLGGILWLVGVVWGFMSYSVIQAIGLLVASFILGAIIGIKSVR